jgi:predicted hotdog family 3-hydroxylacyl-ACP dehydratase
MCLLDEVLRWDVTRIECRSATHRALDNPLRAQGRLGSVCGIEYAAQAMAVHGALIAPGTSTPSLGYLAGVRRVVLHVARLDDVETDLFISGERINGDEATVVYEFSVRSEAAALLSGRATIVLNAAAHMPAGRAPQAP